MDPDYFTIQQLKEMGMWPNGNMVSAGLIPYIRRLAGDEKKILFVGNKNGEDVLEFLRLLPSDVSVTTVTLGENMEQHKQVFEANKKLNEYGPISPNRLHEYQSDTVIASETFDVVIIDNVFDDEIMNKYYAALKPLGIMAGNSHDQQQMKETLVEFRKPNKISVPISVAFQHIWFWVKP